MSEFNFNINVVNNATFKFKSAEIVSIDYDKRFASGYAVLAGSLGLELYFHWNFDPSIRTQGSPYIPTKSWNWEQIAIDTQNTNAPSLSANGMNLDDLLLTELQQQHGDIDKATYANFLADLIHKIDWQKNIINKIFNYSRMLKPVSFNKIDDALLLDFIKSHIPDFSNYVKYKLEEDLKAMLHKESE